MRDNSDIITGNMSPEDATRLTSAWRANHKQPFGLNMATARKDAEASYAAGLTDGYVQALADMSNRGS